MFTITDHITGETYEVSDRIDLEEKLGELFDTTEEGVPESIDAIVHNAGNPHGEYYGDHEAFLNISVDWHKEMESPELVTGLAEAEKASRAAADALACGDRDQSAPEPAR